MWVGRAFGGSSCPEGSVLPQCRYNRYPLAEKNILFCSRELYFGGYVYIFWVGCWGEFDLEPKVEPKSGSGVPDRVCGPIHLGNDVLNGKHCCRDGNEANCNGKVGPIVCRNMSFPTRVCIYDPVRGNSQQAEKHNPRLHVELTREGNQEDNNDKTTHKDERPFEPSPSGSPVDHVNGQIDDEILCKKEV